MPRETHPPAAADIEALALATVARLPAPFADYMAGVLLRVEDFPDAGVVQAMNLGSEWDILGLYQGRSVSGRVDPGPDPDIVFLYRRPILDEWLEGEDSLEALVAHVVIHEIGHHFGLSDDDIDRIEAQA